MGSEPFPSLPNSNQFDSVPLSLRCTSALPQRRVAGNNEYGIGRGPGAGDGGAGAAPGQTLQRDGTHANSNLSADLGVVTGAGRRSRPSYRNETMQHRAESSSSVAERSRRRVKESPPDSKTSYSTSGTQASQLRLRKSRPTLPFRPHGALQGANTIDRRVLVQYRMREAIWGER
jgi:hypothetical protein